MEGKRDTMSGMIYGKYRILIDGEIVAETNNVITTHGKREILNILSGRSNPPSTLAYGVGETDPATWQGGENRTLEAPVGRVSVSFMTPIYDGTAPANSKIVFKGRLSDDTWAEIHEIGLSGFQAPEAQLVTAFDGNENFSGDVPTPVETGHRIGTSAAGVTAGDTPTLSREMPFVSAQGTDQIVLIGWCPTTTGGNVSLTLYDRNGNTAQAAFNGFTTTYGSVAVDVSGFSLTGSFNWDEVVSLDAAVTGQDVNLDGLTIRSESLFGGLFSRAVYGTPVVKRPGARMDLEYELGIDLS